MADEEPVSYSFPIKTYLPEGLQIVFADGLYVTFDRGTFVLSFTQIEQPLVAGSEEAERITEVRSRCVARLSISPERFADMLKVMVSQWERFGKALAEATKASGEKDNGD